jgi:hypothetical protein
MPILYKNNPMPLDGALFVTNPRRGRKVRSNNHKFDRFIAEHEGLSRVDVTDMHHSKKKGYAPKRYAKLRKKYLKTYMGDKEQRVLSGVVRRAVSKMMIGEGKGKAAAKSHAVKMLKKKGFSAKDAGKIFDDMYKAPGRKRKAAPKKKASSTRKKSTSKQSYDKLSKVDLEKEAKTYARSTAKLKKLSKLRKKYGMKASSRIVKAAKKMKEKHGTSTKKGQVRKTARRAYESKSKLLSAADLKKITGKTIYTAKNKVKYVKLKNKGFRFLSAKQVSQLKKKGFKMGRSNPLTGALPRRQYALREGLKRIKAMGPGVLSKTQLNALAKANAEIALLDWGAADLGFYSDLESIKKARKKASSRASASKPKAKRQFLLSGPVAKSTAQAAKEAVKSGKVKAKGKGAACKLMNAWRAFLKYKKARGLKTNAQYYSKFVPEAIAWCVKMGQISKKDGESLLKKMKARYRASRKGSAKKTKATTKRRSTVAKRKTKSRAKSKSKTKSLKTAAKRSIVPARIEKKVKTGRTMLKWGEFRTAFTGCGHTAKALGRMYRKYKAEFEKGKRKPVGAAGRKVKRKSSTKKGQVRKTARRAYVKKKAKKTKKRASASKRSLGKISLAYVKKRASKTAPKGMKTIKGFRLDQLKKDLPKIQRKASALYKKGKSKTSAVDQAITYYRSIKPGKRIRYKGVDLRSKKAARRYNPRRRNPAVGFGRFKLKLPTLPKFVTDLKPFYHYDLSAGWLAEKVAAIPVIGDAASKVVRPAMIGLPVFAAHMLAMNTLGKKAISVAQQHNQQWAVKWIEHFGYTTMGGVVMAAMHLGGQWDLFNKSAAKQIGSLAALVGGGLDLLDFLRGKMAGGETSLQGYGDGGAYSIVNPASIHLAQQHAPGYGALRMNPVHLNGYGALELNGAAGAAGPAGSQGSPGYGAVLFAGSGY